MRQRLALLALSLAVLGGCVGSPGGADAPTEEPPIDATPSAAATPIPTDGTPTAGAPTTEPTADDTTPVPANTVAYENLTERQRAAVRAAVDGEARFVPNTSYVNDSDGYPIDQIDPFREAEYVRYEGVEYRIEFSSGRLYASYQIEASPGAPGGNDTVAALSDLPADVRDEVREAVETGRYYAPAGKWPSLPEPLGETDYVRYENGTYRLAYAVGDTWAPVMSLEPVGEGRTGSGPTASASGS